MSQPTSSQDVTFEQLIAGHNPTPVDADTIFDVVSRGMKGGVTRENTIVEILERNGHQIDPCKIHVACTLG